MSAGADAGTSDLDGKDDDVSAYGICVHRADATGDHDMRSLFLINVGGVAVIVAVALGSLALSRQAVPTAACAEESVVGEILSLNRWEATVRLADGETKMVHRATLKPGDRICVRRK
jgi:hypothetical protein